MSLRYAILASLGNRAQTGYEIARAFDRGVGYFWQASHQQIYRELGRLAEDGAVEFETIDQAGKPQPGMAETWEKSDDRKTYTFHLRPNAVWSDGVPLTTQDFLAALDRRLQAKMAAW